MVICVSYIWSLRNMLNFTSRHCVSFVNCTMDESLIAWAFIWSLCWTNHIQASDVWKSRYPVDNSLGRFLSWYSQSHGRKYSLPYPNRILATKDLIDTHSPTIASKNIEHFFTTIYLKALTTENLLNLRFTYGTHKQKQHFVCSVVTLEHCNFLHYTQ